MVKLTFCEHFLVHWLLVKFTTGNGRWKMLHALHRMSHLTAGRIVSSWQYDIARRAHRAALHSDEHRESVTNAIFQRMSIVLDRQFEREAKRQRERELTPYDELYTPKAARKWIEYCATGHRSGSQIA